MTFKNEYTPLADQPLDSEILTEARTRFRLGHSNYDSWTVDYERESALVHGGSGREPESANQTLWYFMDRKGCYAFTAEEVSRFALVPQESGRTGERTPQDFWGFVRQRSNLSRAEVAIKYKLLGFWGGSGWSEPDDDSLLCIKEALRERQRTFLFDLEAFAGCQLTFVDGRASKNL